MAVAAGLVIFVTLTVAALLSIPVAGALQVVVRELWQISGRPAPAGSEGAANPEPPVGGQQPPGTERTPYDTLATGE